jgi:acetyl esterase/lipase
VASPQFDKLLGILWQNQRARGLPIEDIRAGLDDVALPPGDDVTVTPVDVDGLRAEWVATAGGLEDRAVLYLHGGGYVMGSLATHRKLAGDIARASAARVLLVEYRLAPEHPHPAAVEDAVAAYRWLLAVGYDPGRLAIAGDSAGGGLTIATLVALRDAGDPMPAGAVAISPWADLTMEAASIQSRADLDPMVSAPDLTRFAGWYLDGTDARHPTASPAHADLTGLPPVLVHVGEAEVLVDDSTLLAARGRAAGVDVTLEEWPEMVHVWHVFAGRVPESTAAVERVGAFLRRCFGA